MPAKAVKFAEALPVKAEAMPWLKGVAALKGDVADWARAQRVTGAEVFSSIGMPTPALEGWQYTNLRGLVAEKLPLTEESVKIDVKSIPTPLLADSYRIVLVNGQYRADLGSLPPHISVTPILEAGEMAEDIVTAGHLASTPLVALNAAYLRDGIVLKTEKHKDIDKPVEVLFYNTGDVSIYPRVIYALGENSGVTVLERHTGTGNYFANLYAALVLKRESRLKYYRFIEESDAATHHSYITVRQEKGASFEGFSAATAGAVTRQEIGMQLLESGLSASISGIYLMRGQQVHDFTVRADHFEPHGTSMQHFKGVIDAQARAVFQGKIHVHRPAQKTDGYQSHHALLLSDRAEANAKPELEIYADDVKCSHGATAGRLDPKALFYLRSRGIPLEEARSLMIESFLNEVIERVTSENVRELYRQRVSLWLEQRQ
jgi:Fe-S cluster assembly protein SufD